MAKTNFSIRTLVVICLLAGLALLVPELATAQAPVVPAVAAAAAPAAPAAPVIDTGATAWMLTSSLLVLMMIIPGLALFYGGMVHKESVLAALMQSFVTCCLVSVLWVLYGYSYAFTENNPYIGGSSRVLMAGMGLNATAGTAPALIPESVFVMFQLTFAAITCALILGSVANRIKFSSMMVFIALWFTLVYIPIAHWVWGPKGWLGGTGIDGYMGPFGHGATLDFAGGTVVHINSGIAGLMAALVLGAHKNFGKPDKAPPYNIVFSVIGASLLWVGWFGFNAGSAVAANFNAGMAMLVTHIATATAALSWMAVEWATRGKPSAIGIISGAVAGLVAITPASGFVGVTGAFVIGIAAGCICFFGIQIKHSLKFDDSLDVFGVHCIGGIVGALLTGIYAEKAIGGTEGSFTQFLAQLESVIITLVYGGTASYIILKVVDILMGLRVDEATENAGLDMAIHGEAVAY